MLLSHVLFSLEKSYLLTWNGTAVNGENNSWPEYLHMPCKSCAVLCMLDAAFGDRLWPPLSWSICQVTCLCMCMPGHLFVNIFSKGIWMIVNVLFSVSKLPTLKVFLICFYFLLISACLFVCFRVCRYKIVHNFLGNYSGTRFFISDSSFSRSY